MATPITDLIRRSDLELWKKVTTINHCLNDLLSMKRTRKVQDRRDDYVLPLVRTESLKRCSINRCFLNFI